MATQGQRPQGTTLRIIRVGLLTGMLMFGAIAFLLTRERGGGTGSPEIAEPLQIANIVVLILAAAGIMMMQRKHAVETDPSRRTTWNIAGWAMGEAAAMFGGVHYLLVGNPTPYLVGMAMMLVSFIMVPIRD
jgi:hypothetical protein